MTKLRALSRRSLIVGLVSGRLNRAWRLRVAEEIPTALGLRELARPARKLVFGRCYIESPPTIFRAWVPGSDVAPAPLLEAAASEHRASHGLSLSLSQAPAETAPGDAVKAPPGREGRP